MKLEMDYAMVEQTPKFAIMMAETAASLLLNSMNVMTMDAFAMKTEPFIHSYKVISRKILLILLTKSNRSGCQPINFERERFFHNNL